MIVRCSNGFRTGLVSNVNRAISWASSRPFRSSAEVNMIKGVAEIMGSEVTILTTSVPFIPASSLSSTIKPYARPLTAASRSLARACKPFSADSGIIPHEAKYSFTKARSHLCSATTRTRIPVKGHSESFSDGLGVRGSSKGSSRQNTDPSPGVLSMTMPPPIMSANRWEMASPSPDPPYRLVVDPSACVKA